MFSPDQWLASTGVAFYNGVATQSLRFDDDSSAYLTRTPSSAGNRLKWTWSSWVKQSRITTDSATLLMAGTNGSNDGQIYYTTNVLRVLNRASSSVNTIKDTSALYRDSSAWHHVVCIWDTAQSDADDRVRVYVNGERITSFGSNTQPSQNTTSIINNNVAHRIGTQTNGVGYLDGYLSEVNFVDGLALDPTYFGETKNGVWIPIEPNVSDYGTNGFRLQFDQTGVGTASTSTIGADTSGNTNHWTSSGIVASDCNMPDSPENNFATLNPLDSNSNITLAEGNLKASNTSNNWYSSRGTFSPTSGKWYFEAVMPSYWAFLHIGVLRNSYNVANANAYTDVGNWTYQSDGRTHNDGNEVTTDVPASGAGDVMQVAYDVDDGKLWFGINNTWILSGNPTTGANPVFTAITSQGDISPHIIVYGSPTTGVVTNFGQDSSFAGNKTAQGNSDANGIGDFYYAPPSGFLALCTSNLPEPTISPNADTQADDYFNSVLYTGNGGTQSITDVGFQSDWVWLKNRNGTGIHGLFDSSRGVTKYLSSNSTNAEATASGVTSFDSNGFSLGSAFNQSSLTFVAWNWLANGGTTSSNTDGSITSTVQANTDAGFSIVQFVGDANGSSTVGHGLSKTPNMVIVKPTSRVDGWAVYHSSLGADKLVELHSTNGEQSSSGYWGSVTSSVFGLSAGGTNNRSGATHIAYCFAEIEGYSRFGSHVGNGSTDGTFVYTGFRPAWIMVKCTTTTNDWFIYDTVRDTFNVVENILAPNLSNSESGVATAIRNMDILSNGFKCKGSGGANLNGQTHIYMAFAEQPFKYANAR